jgi:hypothetical protein
MPTDSRTRRAQARETQEQLSARWEQLVREFLPVTGDPPSLWRYSREGRPDDAPQGFKLHVSATVLNAVEVFTAVAPWLRESGTLFKSVRSLHDLSVLNSGLRYGFSQVGKFMTVYPPDAASAVRMAATLHELTARFQAPAVPFDLPYAERGCVYYRYGAFRTIEIEEEDGRRTMAVRDPSGKLVPDRREPGHAVPAWAQNPFRVFHEPVDPASPLGTQVLVFEALSQRGKGGVYRAVDLRELPARFCVLKEARRNGDVTWDGQDARAFLRHEETMLRQLADRVPVPRPLGSFAVSGSEYLLLEFIDGQPLVARCADPRRKMPVPLALAYGVRVARLMASLHAAGCVWRDCKPLNLLETTTGELRPIDFEGAVLVDEPSEFPYGTPAYAPPEVREGAVTGTNLPEDLYALGATLYHLLTSYQPQSDDSGPAMGTFHERRLPLGRLRKGVPSRVRALVAELMHADPRRRPSAAHAAEVLAPFADEGLITGAASRLDPSAGDDVVPSEWLKPSPAEDIPGLAPVRLRNPGKRARRRAPALAAG